MQGRKKTFTTTSGSQQCDAKDYVNTTPKLRILMRESEERSVDSTIAYNIHKTLYCNKTRGYRTQKKDMLVIISVRVEICC